MMTVIDLDERRATERTSVRETGLIRFGDTSMCCALRSLSSAGAALDVTSGVNIPDQFSLFIISEIAIHSCTVIWRMDCRIGVAFN
jgi:PilZ domain